MWTSGTWMTQPTAGLLKLIPRIHNGAIVYSSTSRTNAEILDELLTRWEDYGLHLRLPGGPAETRWHKTSMPAFPQSSAPPPCGGTGGLCGKSLPSRPWWTNPARGELPLFARLRTLISLHHHGGALPVCARLTPTSRTPQAMAPRDGGTQTMGSYPASRPR